MTEESTDGTVRLRGAGIGCAGGGLALGTLIIPFSYAVASIAVVALGTLSWVIARRWGGPTEVGIGVAAVGGIGIIEAATTYGIGMSPAVLAAIAVAFGILDSVLGRVLGRLQPGVD